MRKHFSKFENFLLFFHSRAYISHFNWICGFFSSQAESLWTGLQFSSKRFAKFFFFHASFLENFLKKITFYRKSLKFFTFFWLFSPKSCAVAVYIQHQVNWGLLPTFPFLRKCSSSRRAMAVAPMFF